MNALQTLAAGINSIAGLPTPLSIGFMAKDNVLCIYPVKNGSVIDEDFAGNQETRLYYEIAIRTQDQEIGNAVMWLISTYVAHLTDLPSSEYRFESIETTSEPSIVQADTKGFFTYSIDIAMNVLTNKYKE